MSDHGPIQLKRTRESQGHSKKCKMQKGLTFPGTKCISLVLIIKLICFCQKKKKNTETVGTNLEAQDWSDHPANPFLEEFKLKPVEHKLLSLSQFCSVITVHALFVPYWAVDR